MDVDKPVKLTVKQPKGNSLNGLETIHDQLKRHGTAIIIMQVTAPEVVERIGGIRQPAAVIEWVEGLPSQGPHKDLHAAGEQLMQWARAARLDGDEDALIKRQDLVDLIRAGRGTLDTPAD